MINYDRQGSEHNYITRYDLQLAKEERSKLESQGFKVKIIREGGKYLVLKVGHHDDAGPTGHPGEILDED